MNRTQEIKQTFGLAVRKIRLEQQMSQEKLAEKTELHRTYISEVERGERNISLINISKIANALNISLSKLFLTIEREESDTNEGK